MIKFKAKHLDDRGYSMHLPGNGGEEELVIFTSWGQDFKSKLVIVSAQCDGDVKVIHDGKSRHNVAVMLTMVDNAVRKWAASGIKPTPEQQLWLDKQHEKLMKKWVKKWDVIDSPMKKAA
jgi:hypothetical protein